jgi:20S proteasome alpha/beta subunit
MKHSEMTYILGSRCQDGVVLVADRRFTVNQGGSITPTHGDKLYTQFSGIIMGFSGSRGGYELFETELEEYINTARGHNQTISRERFILKTSEIARKYQEFDILIGMSSNPSTLKYMHSDGGIETVNERVAIGTGEPVGRFFLNKYWNRDMKMKQVAELGYFIIKVIME